MTESAPGFAHDHIFLGTGHDVAERRSWAVIWLCAIMMLLEITGGLVFGSIALVADGLHMSTHAGALLLAAMAYSCARRYCNDSRFTFGTGKFGDLAGFTSAIVLSMISLLIGYEAVTRLFHPTHIHFAEAIPIAVLGLAVNIGSVWLLSGGHHAHGHGHSHGHDHAQGHEHDDAHRITTQGGPMLLSVFEKGVPPRFRLRAEDGAPPGQAKVTTIRPDGARQVFDMADHGNLLESIDEIPEPHAFRAILELAGGETHEVPFEEHVHADTKTGRDNNMRAALVHVIADALVSVLVILGLLLARLFGWLWLDPLAGLIGAGVIASWAYGLVRDTGAILLDMNPDRDMAKSLREVIETDGDTLADLHLWRLGPGHLGAIVSIITPNQRNARYYQSRLGRFHGLSHLTVEIHSAG